jgi:hypothetical protein
MGRDVLTSMVSSRDPRTGRAVPFVIGLVLILGTGAVASLVSQAVPESNTQENRLSDPPQLLKPEIDIHREGPLPDGVKVSLEVAKEQTPYRLPVPPTTEKTGDTSGIWINPALRVAFVWKSDLRFYAGESQLTEEETVAEWTVKVATDTKSDRVLTTARGHPAIAAEGDERRPSSLTFMENGLLLQFVAPNHSLEELRQFAEAISYE